LLSSLLDGTARVGEVKEQLDRASSSIALNIAEVNGKYTPKDRCRFFDMAHGSALECAAGLDILVAYSYSSLSPSFGWMNSCPWARIPTRR
jgi:four helix bundle protein